MLIGDGEVSPLLMRTAEAVWTWSGEPMLLAVPLVEGGVREGE
jgi:hypothetical protein